MMTAALISNKPDFVRLFLENGVQLMEFATLDTLVWLYKNLEPYCLFHTKLQKVLIEDHGRLTCEPDISQLHMHHVAQVLRELLGDSTQLLYSRPQFSDWPQYSAADVRIKVSAGHSGTRDVDAGGCWGLSDMLVMCDA